MPDNHCLGFVAVHVKHYQSLSTLADTTSAMVQTSPVEDNRNDSPDVDMNTLSDSKDSARDPKTRAEQIHGSTWAIPDVFTSQELASDANDELDVSDMGESRTKRRYERDVMTATTREVSHLESGGVEKLKTPTKLGNGRRHQCLTIKEMFQQRPSLSVRKAKLI